MIHLNFQDSFLTFLSLILIFHIFCFIILFKFRLLNMELPAALLACPKLHYPPYFPPWTACRRHQKKSQFTIIKISIYTGHHQNVAPNSPQLATNPNCPYLDGVKTKQKQSRAVCVFCLPLFWLVLIFVYASKRHKSKKNAAIFANRATFLSTFFVIF